MNELVVFSMPWEQSGFPIWWMFAFCLMFFFFFLVVCLFFFRRGSRMWGMCNREWLSNTHPKDILKDRLAKGEISEMEYDNLMRKISSNA